MSSGQKPDQIIKDIKDKQTFVIWHENLNAITIFNLCRTQWRNLSQETAGLDYLVAEKIAKMVKIEWDIHILKKIQTMEDEMIEIIKQKNGMI